MTKKNALLSGLLFGVFMSIYFCFVNGLITGLVSGPIAGIMFGVAMYWFANSKMVKNQLKIEEEGTGDIVFAGAANHFLNGEGVGGKLFLLHDRLKFKSHKFNIQNHELDLDINEIQSVGEYNTLGLVPNGLQVTTTNGKTEKFVVNNRKQWVAEISKLKA